MSTISRRAFLKTVGVGALSVAAMSVLAGCDVAGTQTPAAGATTVEAKAGVLQQVSDLVTVNTATGVTDEFTVTGTSWGKTYVNKYETALTDYDSYVINSVSKYQDATQEMRDAAKKAAEDAVKSIEKETVTVSFNVKNYGDSPIVLVSSMKDGKVISDAFKATCNGTAVDCTIAKNSDDSALSVIDTKAVTVKCTITLPANAKSFDLTVTLPGAEKALKYTFTNKEYTDCDPTKPEFYAINN